MAVGNLHSSSIDTQDSDEPVLLLTSRRNTQIDHRQVRNIVRAVDFARRTGRPLNYFVTLNLGHSACDIDHASETFSRLRNSHFTKWLRDVSRRERQPGWWPAYFVWSIEDKPGHPNVHWLVHLPIALRARFEAKLHVWLNRLAGPLDSTQKAIHIIPAPTPMGAAKYLSKAIDPRHAKLFKIRAVPQGIIKGKRAGISAALGPAAIRRATLVKLTPINSPNDLDQKHSSRG